MISIKQPDEGIDSSWRASAEACAATRVEAIEAMCSEAQDAGDNVFVIFSRLLFFEAHNFCY
jgi:hypothetical protein